MAKNNEAKYGLQDPQQRKQELKHQATLTLHSTYNEFSQDTVEASTQTKQD